MFESATVYDNTPLLSRQFITTTYRSRLRFCTPKVFFRTLRGCLSEYLLMTILMFISIMTVENAGNNSDGSSLMVAIGNGFLYAVVVSISMQISAGFLNPAVTIGVTFAGVLNPITAFCYFLMQILGAVTGAAIASLYSEGAVNLAVQHLHQLPGKGADDIEASTVMLAIFFKFLAASLLVMAVLITAVDKASKLKNVAPVILGFAVTVASLATIKFTGGSVNPATSFGPAVIGTDDNRWDYHYIHWIGPNLAGIISAVVYRLFFASKAWIPIFRQAMDDDDDDSDDVVTSIN